MNYAAIFYFSTPDDELKNYLQETADRWGAVQLADTAWGFRESTKRIDDFLYLLWNNREALVHRAVLYGRGIASVTSTRETEPGEGRPNPAVARRRLLGDGRASEELQSDDAGDDEQDAE